MRIVSLLIMTVLLTSVGGDLPAQGQTNPKKNVYHDGWIDLNKNGRMDVYENQKAPIDRRVEDLLSQMNLNEKTCQTATLYGYKRVLQDELPTPDWKNQIWKDGIANIDEHLNGVSAGSKSIYAND